MKALLGTAMALVLVSGLAVSAHAQVASTPMAPVATAPGTGMGMHHGMEHHPEIHHSIEKLEKAKYDLEHAAHDYGGHRVAAIHAIDGALGELHAALEYEEHEHH